MTIRLLAVMLSAVAVLAAGCTDQKEPPMQTLTQDTAEELVRGYAGSIAKLAGVSAGDHETGVSATPCQGRNGETAPDGRFYVQGNYQIPLDGARHPEVLAQLRDTWQQQGWQIKEFRMFTSTEGTVSAENPADQVQVAVESSRPATALAVVILTPCYLPAT